MGIVYDEFDSYPGPNVFEDDFETGDFSKWDSAQIRWTVQSGVKYSGSYAAKGASGVMFGDYLYKAFASSYSVLRYKFRARASLPSAKPHCSFCNVTLQSGGYLRCTLPFNGRFTYQDPSYAAGYWDGYYYRPLPVDTAWVADTWYEVEVLIDIPNQIWHFWIDGEDKGTAPLYIDAEGDPSYEIVEVTDKILDAELDFDTKNTGCDIYVDEYVVS